MIEAYLCAMIIYNVTIKIVPYIEAEWLEWIKDVHIPAVLGTACFNSARILQLLEIDKADGPTYAIQYSADSRDLYNRYIRRFSQMILQQSLEKWGDQFVTFSTVMEVVN
jgi:hypothetical protein